VFCGTWQGRGREPPGTRISEIPLGRFSGACGREVMYPEKGLTGPARQERSGELPAPMELGGRVPTAFREAAPTGLSGVRVLRRDGTPGESQRRRPSQAARRRVAFRWRAGKLLAAPLVPPAIFFFEHLVFGPVPSVHGGWTPSVRGQNTRGGNGALWQQAAAVWWGSGRLPWTSAGGAAVGGLGG